MVAVRSGSSTPCCSRPCPASSSDSSRRKCRHAWRFSLGGFWGVSEWSHWNSQSLSYPDRKARESALALACLWVDLATAFSRPSPPATPRRPPAGGLAAAALCWGGVGPAVRGLPVPALRALPQPLPGAWGGGEVCASQPKERRPPFFSMDHFFAEFRGRSIALFGGFIRSHFGSSPHGHKSINTI